MESVEASIRHRDMTPQAAAIGSAEVEAALARILASPAFRSNSRRRDLLTYLVKETLAGRGDRLKGYTVAVAVFGRDASFDSQADPVVRLEARRLRRDLDSYYAGEGAHDPVRLSIPKGGYAMHFERAEAAGETAPRPMAKSLRRLWAAGALLAALLIGGVVAWTQRQPPPEPLSAAGPAIIVLPFEALGHTAEGEILAAGLTQQLMSELVRYSSLRVYSPRASFGETANADPAELGQRLGVSYVVGGSVYTSGADIRLSARLVNARTGQVLWSDTYDRTLTTASLLAIQADIAEGIGAALGPAWGVVISDVTRQVRTADLPTMPSYSCVLQAHVYRRNFETDLYAPTLACLREAVRRDPGYSDAWALLGWLEMDGIRFDFTPEVDRETGFATALETARHAVALDDESVLALQALSSIEYYSGQVDEAERTQRAALALHPNDPETLAHFGWRLAARGKWDEGIGYLEKAIDRAVNPPGWYFHLIAIHQYLHGDYAAMLTSAERGSVEGSGVGQALIAIAQGALGNRTAAHDALTRMAEIEPQLGSDPAGYFGRTKASTLPWKRWWTACAMPGWTCRRRRSAPCPRACCTRN